MEGQRRRERRAPVLAFLLVLLGLLGYYALSYPLNHDAAWWLHVARLMLDGVPLYSEIIEVNPPLDGYLSMLPVLVAKWLGTQVAATFEIVVLLLAVSLIVWSVRDLSRSEDFSLQAVLAVGLALAFLGAPAIDFGQREHLMFMLSIPYLLVLWRRVVGLKVSAPAGLFAGTAAAIGFSLKPHFALVWLAIEGWHWLKSRREGAFRLFRIELLSVVGFVAAYLTFVWLKHPDYFRLVPKVGSVYWDFNRQSPAGLIARPAVIALGIAALLTAKRLGRIGDLAQLFVVVGGAGFAIMLLQGKGWSYHEYPILASVIVAACLLSYRAVIGWRKRSYERRLVGGVLALAVAIVAVAFVTTDRHLQERRWKETMIERRLPFLEDLPSGSSVLILSDLMENAFPLVVLADVKWASPFPNLWWVKARYAGDRPAGPRLPTLSKMPPFERDFVRALVRHVRTNRPDYVLVDQQRASVYGGGAFPYLEYLGRDPAFGRAWQRYEYRFLLDGLAVWERVSTD